MSSYNRITLVGHLGRDAELRSTPNGKQVLTASLAVEDTLKKDDRGKYVTEWYRVKVWNKQAEALAPYMLRGKQILAEGRLSIQTWTDKEGKNRYTPEVSADRIVLLGGGERSEGRGTHNSAPQDQSHLDHAPDAQGDDDLIPF